MSLQDKYRFYSAYHQNYYNRIVHIVTVPIICLSTLLLLPKSVGDLLLLAYNLYYNYLDSADGLKWSIFFGMPLWFLRLKLADQISFQTALGVNVLAWLVQVIVGHWIFEQNQPAFLIGLWDSVTISPLFVMMETEKLLFII